MISFWWAGIRASLFPTYTVTLVKDVTYPRPGDLPFRAHQLVISTDAETSRIEMERAYRYRRFHSLRRARRYLKAWQAVADRDPRYQVTLRRGAVSFVGVQSVPVPQTVRAAG